MKGHGGAVYAVAFHPDGRWLASASHDGTVKVWTLRPSELAITAGSQSVPVHRGRVNAIAFDPTGDRIISCSEQTDGIVILDTRTGTEILRFPPQGGMNAFSIPVSRDGSRVATGKFGGTLHVWDARSGKSIWTANADPVRVDSVAFSVDGRRLAVGTGAGVVKFWDAKTGALDGTLSPSITGLIHALTYSPDGSVLAAGTSTASVVLWDAVTGRVRHSLKHSSSVDGIAFNSDGKRIATAGADGSVRIWDALTGAVQLTLRGHGSAARGVAFTPDGSRLVSAGRDGTVKLWDSATGAEVLSLDHGIGVNAVAVAANGRIAAGCLDGSVRIWDARTADTSLTLSGHASKIVSATFTSDGSRIVSRDETNRLLVWDKSTGKRLEDELIPSDAVGNGPTDPNGRIEVILDDRVLRLRHRAQIDTHYDPWSEAANRKVEVRPPPKWVGSSLVRATGELPKEVVPLIANPFDPDANRWLSNTLYSQGRNGEAYSRAVLALATGADDSTFLSNSLWAAWFAGEWRLAVEFGDLAIRAGRRNLNHALRGTALVALGRYEEAVIELRKGPPEYGLTQDGLAVALAALGRKEEADTARAAAEKFASHNAQAYRNRTFYLLTLPPAVRTSASNQLALVVARRAVTAHPQDDSANFLHGLALYEIGDYAAARARFDNPVLKSTKSQWNYFAAFMLVASEARLGRSDTAREQFATTDRLIATLTGWDSAELSRLARFRAEARLALDNPLRPPIPTLK